MPFKVESVNPKHESLNGVFLPLYANRTFCQAIADLHNIELSYLIVYNSGELWALMPMFEKTRYGIRQLITPILSYYNPIVWLLPEQQRPNKNLLHKLEITSIISDYLIENYRIMNINLSPETYDVRSFQNAGITAKPMFTFLYNLSPDYEPNFFAKEGTSLRKAQRMGIEIREEFLPDQFISLLEKTNERQERTFNISREKHLRLLKTLSDAGMMIQLNAFYNDSLISSLLILNDTENKALYAWQNGTNPEYLHSGVAIFLHYHAIMKYKESYLLYDLCGANHPGISRFKAAIGAELKLFFRLEYRKSGISILKLR
ncbi:MAG: GNAT family N-acetyltransferase [Candidatus Cloacimonetes bacterium]|nr:GNAT family N-acetyltransferase [Candidatus Cloacimonadota bacterium]